MASAGMERARHKLLQKIQCLLRWRMGELRRLCSIGKRQQASGSFGKQSFFANGLLLIGYCLPNAGKAFAEFVAQNHFLCPYVQKNFFISSWACSHLPGFCAD
jgi:hypothetical protein